MLISYFRKIGVVWLLCTVSLCQELYAQQTLLTIQNLIDSANAHYPLLQQKQFLIQAAEAAVQDSRSEFLPKVIVADQLSAGSNNAIRGAYLPFGSAASVSAVIRDDNSYDAATGNFASVYSEYVLSDFGYRTAKIKSMQAVASFRRADLEREAYVLKLNICRTYFNILQRRNQLKADLQNKLRYQNIYKVIWAVSASGIKAGVDSSLARAEVSKAVIIYNQTALALQQLYADLSLQTGIGLDKLSLDSFAQVFKDKPIETLNIPANLTINPLLEIYKQNQLVAQQNRLLISKSYLPKLIAGSSLTARGSSITGQDDFKNIAQGFGYQRFNYLAGVGISYDLFNGLRKKRKLAVAGYELQALKAEIDFQRLSLLNIARKAALAAENAKATLNELPLQASAAEQVYQQKLAQYKAGIADLVDLTNASFVVYRSQTDYIQALGDWYRSSLEKAAADGQLNSFIQSIK